MKKREEEREDYCKAVVDTMLRQISATMPKGTIESWGIGGRVTCGYDADDYPTMTMNVSGLLFKGTVRVTLNEGSDLYDVTFFDMEGKQVKKKEDVFCDQLGALIDGFVERDPSWSNEEYEKQVQERTTDMEKLIMEVVKHGGGIGCFD